MPVPTTTKLRLTGHVVTMDAACKQVPNGVIYIDGTNIVAVQDAKAPPPDGFASVPAVDTGGIIFPGLIELHNHLSYNTLRTWRVPAKFANRGQWPRHPEYSQLVTGPMGVLGRSTDPSVLAALVRYVEAKCLVAGVTTSQGIALASNAGIRHYYKGIVRNVESPDDPAFPKAGSHIPDLAASEWKKFDNELVKAKAKASCMLLHLSEGIDQSARNHFLALESGDTWAINSALAGIHCAALEAPDFEIMAQHGGSMVWSPLSNYLLYGDTAKVHLALEHKVPVALGSDWSPTGSKNLLGELKVAKLANDQLGTKLSDADIVALVTRNAAAIVKWDKWLGSIEPGKRADLTVVAGKVSDPHGSLIRARERDVLAVLIRGTPRYGDQKLMKALGATGESLIVGGQAKLADFNDPLGDPDVDKIPLADAISILKDVLARIPNLETHERLGRGALHRPLAASAPPRARLLLEEPEGEQPDHRTRHAFFGAGVASPVAAPAGASLAAKLPLIPLQLDALTVDDDPDFRTMLGQQQNLPAWLSQGLQSVLSQN
jgi:hypothetical protein